MEIVPSLGRQVKVLSGVLVNRHISSWTNAPDWIMFERYFSKLPNPQTNEYLNIVLSIETVPVPKSTVATLLAYDSKAIDEQSLLVAFRQSCSTRDVLHQLLDHIIQFQMTHLIRLASTKLLHECAKANCIEGARAVIKYFPESLDYTDVMGLRPLHGAFSYQNRSVRRSEMVKLLIKEGMKNSIGGEYGCGGVFLERSAAGHGGSPFELCLYYLRQADAKGEDCEDQWKCLTACFEASKSMMKDFQLVNYIIKLRVEMEGMLRKIVERYRINLNCLDEKGMTPLLVAIQKKKPSYIRTLLSIQNCALEQIQSCDFNGRHYSNRFPLHFAFDLGITCTDGLKEIIESNKAAVEILDRETGLYPFMLAAQHKNNPLNDTYQLLRCNPSVLKRRVAGNKSHQRPSSFGIHHIHIIVGAILGIVVYIFSAHFSSYFITK